MTATGLAAVHAAAESVSKSDHEAALSAAREEGRQAGHAAGKAEGLTEGKAAAVPTEQALATARVEGATAERERILGIESVGGIKGHEELIAKAKADGKSTKAEVAVSIIQAEQAKGGVVLANLKADGGNGAAAAPTAGPPVPAATKATTPEGWAAEYKASPQLQAEFPSEAAYVATMKAEAGGKVRYLKK